MPKKRSDKPIKEVEDLRRVMKQKRLSPERAAPFIGCTFREIYRWLDGEAQPMLLYRRAIAEGVRRMKEEL